MDEMQLKNLIILLQALEYSCSDGKLQKIQADARD